MPSRAVELGHVDVTLEDRDRRTVAADDRLDFRDDDRPADGDDRVRRPDLDDLTRLHLVLDDGDRRPAGGEAHRRRAGDLGDREYGAFAGRDRGLAAEQDAHRRALAGGDPVLEQDVVLEMQRSRLRERGARDRRRSDELRHHTGARLFSASHRRQHQHREREHDDAEDAESATRPRERIHTIASRKTNCQKFHRGRPASLVPRHCSRTRAILRDVGTRISGWCVTRRMVS